MCRQTSGGLLRQVTVDLFRLPEETLQADKPCSQLQTMLAFRMEVEGAKLREGLAWIGEQRYISQWTQTRFPGSCTDPLCHIVKLRGRKGRPAEPCKGDGDYEAPRDERSTAVDCTLFSGVPEVREEVQIRRDLSRGLPFDRSEGRGPASRPQ